MEPDYDSILRQVCEDVTPYIGRGSQADYIPALARVNPDQFGICLTTLQGATHTVGDTRTRFSIQSISKVFALAMCLSLEGDRLWQRMGREPSGNAFNSLVQLEYEQGVPRNPFINAGAIVMADVLTSYLPDAAQDFLVFMRKISGSYAIDYNPEVAASEQSCGYMNAAIANLLKYHHRLHNEVTDVLHLYFQMCSLEMNCQELASAFLAFAGHRQFLFDGIRLTPSQVKRINALMQTCGLYDEAGDFSYLVGLPGKSGVSGAIAAVYPQRYAVCVWSPRLNDKGNSVVGMQALERLTSLTAESIF